MGVLARIVLAGWVAKLLLPGRHRGGLIARILGDIAGPLVGGFFGRGVAWYGLYRLVARRLRRI
jgi:uncharacterized membrane protein YeaQ/YmgE (transglycosylase-associated protein family)